MGDESMRGAGMLFLRYYNLVVLTPLFGSIEAFTYGFSLRQS
jgi:hypothetical protein